MSQSECSNSEEKGPTDKLSETNSPRETRDELLTKLRLMSSKLRCKTRKVTSLRRSLQRVRRDSEYENSYGPKYQLDKILGLAEVFQQDHVHNVNRTEIPYLCELDRRVVDDQLLDVPVVPTTGRIDLAGAEYILPENESPSLLKKDKSRSLYRGSYQKGFYDKNLALNGYSDKLTIYHAEQTQTFSEPSDSSMYGITPTQRRAQCLGDEPPIGTLQKCKDYIDFHYDVPWNFKGLADGTVNTDLSDEFCSVSKIYLRKPTLSPWFSFVFCVLYTLMVTYIM